MNLGKKCYLIEGYVKLWIISVLQIVFQESILTEVFVISYGIENTPDYVLTQILIMENLVRLKEIYRNLKYLSDGMKLSR